MYIPDNLDLHEMHEKEMERWERLSRNLEIEEEKEYDKEDEGC